MVTLKVIISLGDLLLILKRRHFINRLHSPAKLGTFVLKAVNRVTSVTLIRYAHPTRWKFCKMQ